MHPVPIVPWGVYLWKGRKNHFQISMHGKTLHMVTWVLIIVGALNWLLVGVGGFMGSNWNLVNLILGSWPAVEWLVYVLVGLSGVYELFTHKKNCRLCGSSANAGGM